MTQLVRSSYYDRYRPDRRVYHLLLQSSSCAGSRSQSQAQCTPAHHVGDGLWRAEHHPGIPGPLDLLLHRPLPGGQTQPGGEGGAAEQDQPPVRLPPQHGLLLPGGHHLSPPAGPAPPPPPHQDPPAGHLLPGVVPHILHSPPQTRRQTRHPPGPQPRSGLDETP